MKDGTFVDSRSLYSLIALDYDKSYAVPSTRRAYETLALELIDRLLPGRAARVIDVGCGTGREAERLIGLGHHVTGIERASGMLDVLRARRLPEGLFTLVEADMEDARQPDGEADLVLAMGSLQYSRRPHDLLARLASWVRPGGAVAVYVDSLVALVCELMRKGRREEALEILSTRRGTFRTGGQEASLRMLSSEELLGLFRNAGLVDVACRGLCVSAGFLGREGIASAMTRDEAAFLADERILRDEPAFADQGLHLFAWGFRPGPA